MQIGKVSTIALSGMRAETERLGQSAKNVANVNTDGYEAQHATSRERAGGGVTTELSPTYGPSGRSRSADTQVEQQPSTTDVAEERVTQLSSVRSFQANVAVLRTADEMMREFVRLKA